MRTLLHQSIDGEVDACVFLSLAHCALLLMCTNTHLAFSLASPRVDIGTVENAQCESYSRVCKIS